MADLSNGPSFIFQLDESVRIRDDVLLNMSSLCRILRWWCIQAFCFGLFTSLSFSKIFFPLVFMILFEDTGGWSSWSNFGPCYEDSYKCLRDRQRYCSHKNRNKCPGANKYGVQKQTKPCPHSCSSKYIKWSKSGSLRQNMHRKESKSKFINMHEGKLFQKAISAFWKRLMVTGTNTAAR